MVTVSLQVLAAAAVVVALVVYGSYRKGKADGIQQTQRAASHEAHEQATEREPPVDIGDSVSLAVKEFRAHHSGERAAVCKKEGFVIFVDGVPDGVDVGDVIDAEIVDFGRNRNSAEAQYVG